MYKTSNSPACGTDCSVTITSNSATVTPISRSSTTAADHPPASTAESPIVGDNRRSHVRSTDTQTDWNSGHPPISTHTNSTTVVTTSLRASCYVRSKRRIVVMIRRATRATTDNILPLNHLAIQPPNWHRGWPTPYHLNIIDLMYMATAYRT